MLLTVSSHALGCLIIALSLYAARKAVVFTECVAVCAPGMAWAQSFWNCLVDIVFHCIQDLSPPAGEHTLPSQIDSEDFRLCVNVAYARGLNRA